VQGKERTLFFLSIRAVFAAAITDPALSSRPPVFYSPTWGKNSSVIAADCGRKDTNNGILCSSTPSIGWCISFELYPQGARNVCLKLKNIMSEWTQLETTTNQPAQQLFGPLSTNTFHISTHSRLKHFICKPFLLKLSGISWSQVPHFRRQLFCIQHDNTAQIILAALCYNLLCEKRSLRVINPQKMIPHFSSLQLFGAF